MSRDYLACNHGLLIERDPYERSFLQTVPGLLNFEGVRIYELGFEPTGKVCWQQLGIHKVPSFMLDLLPGEWVKECPSSDSEYANLGTKRAEEQP